MGVLVLDVGFLAWKGNRIVQEQTHTCFNLFLCSQITQLAVLAQEFSNCAASLLPHSPGNGQKHCRIVDLPEGLFVLCVAHCLGLRASFIITRASLPGKQWPEELGDMSAHNLRP